MINTRPKKSKNHNHFKTCGWERPPQKIYSLMLPTDGIYWNYQHDNDLLKQGGYAMLIIQWAFTMRPLKLDCKHIPEIIGLINK
jgi:hypothetical protein